MNVREIAKSIAEELRANPSLWTQHWYARTISGASTPPTSPDFHSGCLIGNARRICADDDQSVCAFRRACAEIVGHPESPAQWNDAPGRSVEEVIALCEKVAAGDAS